MADIQKYGWFGGAAGILAYILSWGYNLFINAGITQAHTSLDITPLTEGLKNQIKAGVDTGLAGKIIGYLNGLPILSVEGFFTLLVAGAIIGIVGGILLDFLGKGLPALKKSPVTRAVSIMVFGSVVVGWITTLIGGSGVQLPTIMVVITMVIYWIVVALVYNFLAGMKYLDKLMPSI